MSTLERFEALVQRSEVPLGLACATIAEHLGHPTSAERTLAKLDALAVEVAGACAAGARRVDLEAIAGELFGSLGFTGNRADYYDVRNSLLPDVLRRRTGIPITLSIVVLEVAARLGVPAVGVGMPGHFLVGEGRRPRRWLDPFDGGRWLDRRGAEERFHAVHGPDAAFEPAYLAPTAGGETVGRVLNNLAAIERGRGELQGLLRVLELRARVPRLGGSPRSMVELSAAYAEVGRVTEAIAALEAVRPRVDPRSRAELESRLEVLRASLN
jgi:regulator of sirC expression with transglutaminase-like and TPR domain